MATSAEPAIAVIFPLADTRGQAVPHLRSWTHGQTLDRHRFRVVVASDGADRDLERDVGELLAPHDVLARAEGTSPFGLYDLAASRARTPWLMLTEGHCLAEPGCLAAVARWIEADPEAVAGNAEIRHQGSPRTLPVMARWFDGIFAQWASASEWQRLILGGFVIRRPLYEDAGGMDGRYGLFSAPLLAARLHQRGVRIPVVPGAGVVHVEGGFPLHYEHTAEYVEREFDWRATGDPVFGERYFGHSEVWAYRFGYRREVARDIALAHLTAAWYAVHSRPVDLMWMIPRLATLVPSCVAGIGPRRVWEELATSWGRFFTEHLPGSRETRWRRFARTEERAIRLAGLEWIRYHDTPPSSVTRRCGSWAVEALADDQLVGVHGLERHEDGWFRWTRPLLFLRIAPPSGTHVLRLDTGGIRGSPLSFVAAVCAGGRILPRRLLAEDGGTLVVHLPSPWCDRAAADGLAVVSRPLRAPDDERALGMPLVSVAVSNRGAPSNQRA